MSTLTSKPNFIYKNRYHNWFSREFITYKKHNVKTKKIFCQKIFQKLPLDYNHFSYKLPSNKTYHYNKKLLTKTIKHMENYYLLAVICCLSPFIVGGILFAFNDHEKVQLTQPNSTFAPVIQGVEDLMLKEYYYSDVLNTHTFNRLLSKLKKVNRYDPTTRRQDEMDICFKQATRDLCHDGVCLAYIDHYGYITDTFFKNLIELDLKPDQDVKFQKLLISTNNKSGFYAQNYTNLLFIYGRHWTLLPEIENILNTDPRFKEALQTYNFSRQCAERDRLKASIR